MGVFFFSLLVEGKGKRKFLRCWGWVGFSGLNLRLEILGFWYFLLLQWEVITDIENVSFVNRSLTGRRWRFRFYDGWV